eukprot:scaffold672_cov126-Cylindrotheca_fusiformis.AAC.14
MAMEAYINGENETPDEAGESAARSIEDKTNNNDASSEGDAKESQERTTEEELEEEVEEEVREIVYVLYISAAAILGACLRVYMSRFFGADCEDDSVHDFLTPASKHICLTSGGRTEQTGGALFRDLPPNMLGSFFMGLVSSNVIRIPWIRKDHPLQKDDVFHVSITTAFCGSLTTFASWNSQMVTMMDGTYCELGSQVVVAICGYIVGLMLAISSFQFGQHVATLLCAWTHRNCSEILAMEEIASDVDQKVCCSKIWVLLPTLTLVALFIVGAVVDDIQFYRNMILLWVLAPFGALIRWKLAKWNSPSNRSICTEKLIWLPAGTLFVNLMGAVISIVCTGILDRDDYGEDQSLDSWTTGILFAVKTGFAGNLSTVSTMVKEIVFLSIEHPGQMKSYLYVLITFVGAITAGLVIYSPIVRIQ